MQQKTNLLPTLCVITNVLICTKQAALLTMLSDPQSFLLSPGETVDLSCQFNSDDFSMFENPVIWKKLQSHEETPMNIMGNILDPFLSANRFEVSLNVQPSTYQLTLRISETSLEDSGNYTCEVRGRRSTVLATVTHSVAVRTPIGGLYIETDNSSTVLPPMERHRDSSQASSGGDPMGHLVFIEGLPRRLRCVCDGGFPLPEMLVYLGQKDVTRMFMLSKSVSLDGVRGLRRIRYRTERWTDQLVFTAHDDEQPIKCVVTVPGLAANHSVVNINVIYRPIISCSDSSASFGDRNVALRCEVRARPPLTALFWLIDANGTTLTEGKVINEYWTFVMDRSDGIMETKLFMKKVSEHSFRKYTIIAENVLSASTSEVQLLHKPKTESTRDAGIQSMRPPSSHLHAIHSHDALDPAYVIVSSSVASSSSSSSSLSSLSCSHWRRRMVVFITSVVTLVFRATVVHNT